MQVCKWFYRLVWDTACSVKIFQVSADEGMGIN